MELGNEMQTPEATAGHDAAVGSNGGAPGGWAAERSAGHGLERSLLRTMRTHLSLVVGAVVVSVALAALYVARTTPRYVSVARLCVEQETPRVMDDAAGFGRRIDRYLATQASVITSTPILEAALTRLGRDTLPTLAGVRDPVGYLKGALRCRPGSKDDIITVSLELTDAGEAARIVNRVIECYLEYSSRQTRATATELVEVLRGAKQVRDEELRAATEKLLEFRRAHGALLLAHERGGIITQRMAALAQELASAELEAIQAEATFEAARAMRDDPARVVQLLQLLDGNGVSRALEDEETEWAKVLRAAESEHAALLEAYGPDHPDLTACVARIHDTGNRLEACRQRLSEAYLAVAEQRCNLARARAEQLRGPYAAQQDLASDANAKAIEYDLLRAEVQRRERISEILDSRIKEIDVTGDAGALDISVLEWADAGSAPVHPQKPRIFGLALVLGVVLGMIGASVWEWADDRLRTAADLTRRIGLPVLGEVPHLAETAELGDAAEPSLTAKMSEACQSVRTALDWAAQHAGLQTVLVSSPGRGDGKSTLTSSLALVLARAGKRTLVIDADLRDPGQHQIFGVQASPGLEGLLSRGVPFAAAIRPTLIDGLDVLPGGLRPVNPTELLSNERFQHLLELLKLEYEFVLVDSPAVLESADAAVVAARTDGALLVVRAARSTGGRVAQARAALERVGAELVGTVLNDVGCGQRTVRQRGMPAAA